MQLPFPRAVSTMTEGPPPHKARPAGRASLMRAPEGGAASPGALPLDAGVRQTRPWTREEDGDGRGIRWIGRSHGELHVWGSGPIREAAEVDGGRDQRAGVGRRGSEHLGADSPVHGGRSAERL